MKLLLDFLPLILFFATFRYADKNADWAGAFANEHFSFLVSGGSVSPKEAPVLLATVVVIAATLAQVAYLKLRGRRVDLMLWVSLGLVVVLGGLTVWFHNETFIKWKPSGLYWTIGLVLWASQALFNKNLLRRLLGEQITLPDAVWRRLNLAWVIFFGVMGLINLWVVYHFDTSTWVTFKAFGATGLMFLFFIGQGIYLSRHLPEESGDAPAPSGRLPR